MGMPGTAPSNPSNGSFFGFGKFPHTYVLISTLLNTQGRCFADLQGSLCVVVYSPVACPANPSYFVFSRTQLLSSGSLLAYSGFLHAALWCGASLRQYSWEVLWLTSFVSSLSGVPALCCLMSSVLKIVVSYVLSLLCLHCCFRWENDSSPCFSILAGIRCHRQPK